MSVRLPIIPQQIYSIGCAIRFSVSFYIEYQMLIIWSIIGSISSGIPFKWHLFFTASEILLKAIAFIILTIFISYYLLNSSRLQLVRFYQPFHRTIIFKQMYFRRFIKSSFQKKTLVAQRFHISSII